MSRVPPFAAVLLLLCVASAAGAEGGDEPAQEKVGGVELGDPQWRRSHFSAEGQGYGYPSYLAPRSWARDAGGAQPAYRSSDTGYGYTSKRTYDARRYHRDRTYDARRYHRDRTYDARRYWRDRRYANERY